MNGTIAQLTLSTLLRKWRGILLALLPLTMLGLSAFLAAVVGEADVAEGLLGGLNLTTVVPLVALIIGTGAISTEVDDGSIGYLLTKPVKRGLIISTKYIVAICAALVFAAVPTAIAAIILTGEFGAVATSYPIAAAIACAVYCALFLMVGVVSKQAVMIGLLYILLWEGLICGIVEGARVLSVKYWATSIASTTADTTLVASIGVTTAAILAVVTTLGAIWYAGHRLRSLTIA
ncbi:ABC transporter permease [Stackebrandtia soli]|uniref:ABC transporter permease n=1 Tax=Stackebrandtia soli TaxID=1892856 RepID=UPI0039ED746F